MSEQKLKYEKLVTEALCALDQRSGSSLIAIEKYITANHLDFDFKRAMLRNSLKRSTENGTVIIENNLWKLAPPSITKMRTQEQLVAKRNEKIHSDIKGQSATSVISLKPAVPLVLFVRVNFTHNSPHR